MDRGKGKTRRTRAKVTSTAPIPVQKRTAPPTPAPVAAPEKVAPAAVVEVTGVVRKVSQGRLKKARWEGLVKSDDGVLLMIAVKDRMIDVQNKGNEFIDLHKELKLVEWVKE